MDSSVAASTASWAQANVSLTQAGFHPLLLCARAVRSAWLCACIAWLVACFPARAFAHPELDRALSASDDGRFAESLALLEQALDSHTLSRDELIITLRQRVLMRFALRQRDPLTVDARNLLAIAPHASLGEAAPPDLTARFEQLRKSVVPVRARVQVENLPGGVRVALETEGLTESFRTEIAIRSPDSPWQRTQEAELRYPASSGVALEYYAVVIGPGDVIVAGAGSEAEPIHYEIPRAPEVASQVAVLPSSEKQVDTGERSHRKWWWIGASAVAAVTAATIVTLLATREDQSSKSEITSSSVTFP